MLPDESSKTITSLSLGHSVTGSGLAGGSCSFDSYGDGVVVVGAGVVVTGI